MSAIPVVNGGRVRDEAASAPGGRVPGAAAAGVRDLLAGPPRPAAVLHRGPDAVYLRLEPDPAGDPPGGPTCLAVLSRCAVGVPCGIRTALDTVLPLFAAQARPRVGGGSLEVAGTPGDPGVQVVVGRLVDTSVPRLRPDRRARAVLRAAAAHASVTRVRGELPAAALVLLGAGDPRCVAFLLGRGSGLTPVGDDVLAGYLATRVALGRPAYAVQAQVRDRAFEATSMLSATLLGHAARGEVLPQHQRLLHGLRTMTARPATAGAAARDLVAVGHSSGAGLLLGTLLALDPAPRRGAAR